MSDSLSRLLADLPRAEPDPARAERIRTRCRARLARRAALPRRQHRQEIVQAWPSLVAILGVAYFTEVIVQALRLYGRL